MKKSIHREILSELKSRDLQFLLILAFALLLFWSFVVPVFEAPDEPDHWNVARYLHDRWRLPYYDQNMVEGNQGPLYYLLIAPFSNETPPPSLAVDFGADGQVLRRYPPRNYINAPGDLSKYWPVRISRIVTALLSTIVVLFAFLTGVEATGQRTTGLLAGTLIATLPQFTFRAMNVSNDSLVASMCAFAVYFAVRIARRGYDPESGRWFGVAFGLALLSKINSIFLPLPFALAILPNSSWRSGLRDLFLKDRLRPFWPLAISLAIAGPWMIRNLVLYGDVFATRQMYVAVPNLIAPKAITSPYFATEFPVALINSAIGVFGWMNLPLPRAIFTIYYALGIIGAGGLAWRLIRRRFSFRIALVLLSAIVAAIVLVIQLNLIFTQPQGRYLFTALSAVAVLGAVGIEGLPRWRWGVSALLMGGLVLLNVGIASAIVYPAYWHFPKRPSPSPDVVVFEGVKLLPRELKSGDVLTQEIVSTENGFLRVEIRVPTWTRRIPAGNLNTMLRDKQSGELVAESRIPLETITDNMFVPIEFPAIPNSKGKLYTLQIEAKDVAPGYQVGVWLTAVDQYPDGRLLENGKPISHDVLFRTFVSLKYPFPASWSRQP